MLALMEEEPVLEWGEKAVLSTWEDLVLGPFVLCTFGRDP
jgi:hypothetical protein